jgi:hypothetical protein
VFKINLVRIFVTYENLTSNARSILLILIISLRLGPGALNLSQEMAKLIRTRQWKDAPSGTTASTSGSDEDGSSDNGF